MIGINIDEEQPILFMMIGLVASGKSTYSKKIKEWSNLKRETFIHSSDEIRKELFNDVEYQGDNKKVFDTLHKRVNETLAEGNNAVYDATNLSAKRRRHFLNYKVKEDCKKIAIVMGTLYETCVERNNNRDKRVPHKVLERFYKKFQMPHDSEGFDEIIIQYEDDLVKNNKENFYEDYATVLLINRLKKIHQNNPNHSYTLGGHLEQAYQYYKANLQGYDDVISDAVLLHDIGKPFCMQFKNYQGKPTKIAHYYGHESVSAYEAMFVLYGDYTKYIVDVCNLIQHHMRPHHWTEQSKKKMVRFFGEEFIKKLEIVHECDINAK